MIKREFLKLRLWGKQENLNKFYNEGIYEIYTKFDIEISKERGIELRNRLDRYKVSQSILILLPNLT